MDGVEILYKEKDHPKDGTMGTVSKEANTADSDKDPEHLIINQKKREKNPGSDSPTKVTKKVRSVRVKPERVQEVYGKIIEEMTKNASMGLSEMPMEVLAAAVGYKHPRSDAILEAMKLLKKDGLLNKTKDTCQITDKFQQEFVPKEVAPATNKEALKLFWEKLKLKLEGNPKSKGQKVLDAAQDIWKLLQDGQAHSEEEVLAATPYSMVRSTGFGEIMKAMKQLGYTNKKVDGNYKLSDKVFPMGRP